MLAATFGLTLILIALFSLALQRFYSCVPAKELKRLAARGERLAVTLYRAVAYGQSLRILLWSIALICLSAGFLLIERGLPNAVSLFITLVVLSVVAIWLPTRPLTARSARLAVLTAPALEWVLHRIHRPLEMLASTLNGHRHLDPHSGLYERDDLHDLLAQQQNQQDNRIDNRDLDLMQRALQFADTKTADIAVSRKDAPMLSTSDALGPILFDELHKSGRQFFIVYRGKPDNVVGMLALKDAKHSRKGGTVGDVMSEELCFVEEDFTLTQLARAFVSTGQQVAIVINKFEEFVGIISFVELMDFLFAAQMSDLPLVQYEDRAAVANFSPTTQDDSHGSPEPELVDVPTSPEISEVVE